MQKLIGMMKQKTTWAGLALILNGIETYFVGSGSGITMGGPDHTEALQMVGEGLAIIFLRQGIAKGK